MRQATRLRVSVLTFTVSALAVSVCSPLFWDSSLHERSVEVALILMLFVIMGDLFGAVELPLRSAHVSVNISSAFCFGMAVAVGPAGTAAVSISELLVELLRRRPAPNLAFNVSIYALTTFVTGLSYSLVVQAGQPLIASRVNLLAATFAVLVFNLANVGLGSFAVAQLAGTSILATATSILRGAAFTMLTLPTLGMLVPILAQEHPLAILLMAVPIMGPYLSLRSYTQIHRETRATIERLASLIDQRDPYTAHHSRRVTEYVEKIIDELGGISLEDREINRHAANGGDILKDLSLYRRAADVVRHHHERWDGHGYPDGISGEAIPIGARIIAVADTFDAMTTTRPYRAGLSRDCALEEIRRCSGSQFDPSVAAAFLRVMERENPPVELPVLHALAGN
jgi:hypothetical protein